MQKEENYEEIISFIPGSNYDFGSAYSLWKSGRGADK